MIVIIVSMGIIMNNTMKEEVAKVVKIMMLRMVVVGVMMIVMIKWL